MLYARLQNFLISHSFVRRASEEKSLFPVIVQCLSAFRLLKELFSFQILGRDESFLKLRDNFKKDIRTTM